MRLTVKKSEFLTDWYVIERLEHDGREWMETTGPGCMSLRLSSRFSDADVEGPSYEILAIARAIEQRSEAIFKRCSVDATSDPVKFSSPRNSRKDGECSLAEADELVITIRRQVRPEISL